MADQRDALILMPLASLIHQRDDTLLDIQHGFAAWGACFLPPAVPRLPAGIAVQLLERLSRPDAEVDLVEFGADRDFADITGSRDRLGGFLRALAWAAPDSG